MPWIALLVLAIALHLIGCAGCAPASPSLTSDLPLAGIDGAREIPVDGLAGAPAGLGGDLVRTRGNLVAAGRVDEGVWLEIEPPDRPGAATRLMVPPGDAAETLLGYAGREITLAMTVVGPRGLSDGRPALEIVPVQYAARFTAAAPASRDATDLQDQVDAAAAGVSRDLGRGEAGFIGDPEHASSTEELAYQTRFLDPELARPRFSLAGPRSIERSGEPAAPRYRYTAITRSEAAEVRSSVCEFRVVDGRLRSVSYEEAVRDSAERIVSRREIDFSGTYRDKTTATDVPWPVDVYPAPCLELVLVAFPFATDKLVRFHVWTELEPAAPMTAIIDGIERVTVPAGTFDAYRVRMRFDEEAYLARLALPAQAGKDIARSMMEQLRLPHTVFWVSVAKPRRILRTEGPLGPPGITRGVVELATTPATVPDRP
jgi:hypothetical protein